MKPDKHVWLYTHKEFEETAAKLTKLLPIIDCQASPNDRFDEEVCLRRDLQFDKN